jgi:hypothetical protein
MAVGFTLKYNKGSWRTISNPKFVFTSPNMDDQSPAGTRSHIVAGEVDVGTWLEDSALNKMWKLAHAQDESLTWETTIHEYDYTDYRPERVKVATKATTPFSKIYLSDRPTAALGEWFPNPTISGNRFDATRVTYSGSNWWKLDEIWAFYPNFTDSLGNFGLVSSGGVVPLWHWYGVGYVAEFDGDSDSLIYSNSAFSLDDEFCVSFYVDSYGSTSSGTDSFGYNSTFFNVVASGTYFSVGCSETNTITYTIKTDVAEYKSDTGSTLSSGTFNNIVVSYKQTDGLYIYKDNSLIVYNTSVTGTVGNGNLCIGNTSFGYSSTFRGCISDVKYWDNYLPPEDVNEIVVAGQLQEYPICMFGTSVGDYIVDAGIAGPTVIDYGLFYGFPTYMADSHFSDTLHLWMTLGEAYNCYLTAWDDATHSSTNNKAITNELCKITACVWRSVDVNTNGEPDHDQNDTTYPRIYDYVSDYPIKGNEIYYGKFNLVYYVREPNVIGDMVSVRPRISTINSFIFDPGNYDFVITFHYQYT